MQNPWEPPADPSDVDLPSWASVPMQPPKELDTVAGITTNFVRFVTVHWESILITKSCHLQKQANLHFSGSANKY